MGSAVPARVRWAVDLLDPAPTEQILEIGGGPGVSASLICERLTTGRLLAVDRSAVAIERTVQRNEQHLASGRLAVRQAELLELADQPAAFDQALTLDVNLFWVRDASPELEVLRRLLRPGGRLLVLYGAAGPTGADRILGPVAALQSHGFVDVATVTADAGMGVTARAPV